jgi:hypothetical protein
MKVTRIACQVSIGSARVSPIGPFTFPFRILWSGYEAMGFALPKRFPGTNRDAIDGPGSEFRREVK